jgi:FixJ family two-component response regulator
MANSGHIYLIDDDESLRLSLSRMLRELGYVVQEYSSADSFIKQSIPISPAMILLDMQMPDFTGLNLQERLLQLGRRTPIVFISGQSQPTQIVHALKNGALDFLFKPFNLDDLLRVVARAIDFDVQQLKSISSQVEATESYTRLTPREREVCDLLVQGFLNKEIAIRLGTTDATIKVHKARVMEKMGVDSLQSLVRKHMESGLQNHSAHPKPN